MDVCGYYTAETYLYVSHTCLVFVGILNGIRYNYTHAKLPDTSLYLSFIKMLCECFLINVLTKCSTHGYKRRRLKDDRVHCPINLTAQKEKLTRLFCLANLFFNMTRSQSQSRPIQSSQWSHTQCQSANLYPSCFVLDVWKTVTRSFNSGEVELINSTQPQSQPAWAGPLASHRHSLGVSFQAPPIATGACYLD